MKFPDCGGIRVPLQAQPFLFASPDCLILFHSFFVIVFRKESNEPTVY